MLLRSPHHLRVAVVAEATAGRNSVGIMTDGEAPVIVRLFAAAKAAAGSSEVEVRPSTLGAISEELVRRFEALEGVLPMCSFLVDGTQPIDGAISTRVRSGSTVDVLPPFAGG